jgi:myo-inositol-1(or 4)-monophosphatase
MSDDLGLIRQAAIEAGALAMDLRRAGLETWSKSGGSPVTNADLAVDSLLKERLLAARPDYGWLSEETADDPARLGKKRLFVVDPIDGTAAYIKGLPWFSIAIAVVEAGRPIIGIVHAPAVDETYSAVRGGGARLNGNLIMPSQTTVLQDSAMLGDAKMFAHPAWRQPWPVMRFATRNSIAYRMALVAAGAFDAALALSAKNDWDLAAGDLIAAEAGAMTTDHKGARFVYNRPSPLQTSMICATPALHTLILERTQAIELNRTV